MHITTAQLQQLISHNQFIDQEIISLFLEITCATLQSSYLDPSFFPDLEDLSWDAVKNRFSNYSRHNATILRPDLNTAAAIAIPIHINNNHWVAVTRRNLQG
jgi:Ulp1 protease family, C-terminal catalytic domain